MVCAPQERRCESKTTRLQTENQSVDRDIQAKCGQMGYEDEYVSTEHPKGYLWQKIHLFKGMRHRCGHYVRRQYPDGSSDLSPQRRLVSAYRLQDSAPRTERTRGSHGPGPRDEESCCQCLHRRAHLSLDRRRISCT